MKNSVLCIASVLGGMALGSALALAFAPKTGAETRKAVQDFLNEEFARFQHCHNGSCNHEAPKAEVKIGRAHV